MTALFIFKHVPECFWKFCDLDTFQTDGKINTSQKNCYDQRDTPYQIINVLQKIIYCFEHYSLSNPDNLLAAAAGMYSLNLYVTVSFGCLILSLTDSLDCPETTKELILQSALQRVEHI